ncbi:MAG: hypothetical protein NZ602_06155 [Thermoguttaceae bacterium]|nr:hypothetical protein [Thermoguttaceae bacterium]MDW8039193.1 hypothetical protein [Thermoguttaceae bacterium]
MAKVELRGSPEKGFFSIGAALPEGFPILQTLIIPGSSGGQRFARLLPF